MTTILLKLAGPLQAYGINSYHMNRKTERYPSKSGVIGMIAASLGLRRDQDEEIQVLNQLNFAVRIDQPGELLCDYHIAHVENEKDANVTQRYYLQDAVFTVAISGEKTLIKKIEKSLKSPYFQPFLGRRALPLTSDFWLGVVEDDPIEALKKTRWQAAKWYEKKHQLVSQLDLYADADLLDEGEMLMTRDRVISFSQNKRQHGFRSVKHIRVSVNKTDDDTTHDIFSYIEGGV